jgi:hypothetical protein
MTGKEMAGEAGSDRNSRQPDRVSSETGARRMRSPWVLYLLILVCVAPVVASYLAYYVFPPSERTNYGMLIEPQRPVPAITATLIHPTATPAAPNVPVVAGEGSAGSAAEALASGALAANGLAALKGQWLLVAIDRGACELRCAEKLFFMRQTHASLGKERGRLDRVLMVTDTSSLPPAVLAAHPDLVVLQVKQHEIESLFPVAQETTLADHIYLIDPLHNLMMRFPKDPDPTKTRKDLQKLLRASRIG